MKLLFTLRKAVFIIFIYNIRHLGIGTEIAVVITPAALPNLSHAAAVTKEQQVAPSMTSALINIS